MAKRRSTAANATARTVCVEASSLIGRLTSASSAALRQRRAAGVHQEAGGGGPGVGPLLAGRQPLHQAHLHRNRGELRSAVAACFLFSPLPVADVLIAPPAVPRRVSGGKGHDLRHRGTSGALLRHRLLQPRVSARRPVVCAGVEGRSRRLQDGRVSWPSKTSSGC